MKGLDTSYTLTKLMELQIVIITSHNSDNYNFLRVEFPDLTEKLQNSVLMWTYTQFYSDSFKTRKTYLNKNSPC